MTPTRILVAELKQETATFNPARTMYEDFRIYRDEDVVRRYLGTETELAGAIDVFDEAKLQIVPTLAAHAVSGGPIETAAIERLIGELVERVRQNADVDAAYICLHGAMAGEEEVDPEGRLLSEIRAVLGDKPLVASLDLHAVLTDRMIAAADVLVPFHTYPHVDQYETGERAARCLLRLLAGAEGRRRTSNVEHRTSNVEREEESAKRKAESRKSESLVRAAAREDSHNVPALQLPLTLHPSPAKPITVRVELPMLVRGDELITKTGRFGEAIRMCQAIEADPRGIAAGVIIGNAFTDVPDLQSNVLVTTDGDEEYARSEANRIARFMWDNRELFQAQLTSLEEAIRLAGETQGLTVFSDAADATASGASGDSNAILKGLLERKFAGTSLAPIVDAPAVDAAFATGVGATIRIELGGTRDPGRFTPLPVEATVKSLHDGEFLYEDGTQGSAGGVAVLRVGNCIVMATRRPVYVVGRSVFEAHGLDPRAFDVVVVKSPNGFRTWYEAIAARIVPVDVPGSTSANLKSLPYRHCVRPIFPLDEFP